MKTFEVKLRNGIPDVTIKFFFSTEDLVGSVVLNEQDIEPSAVFVVKPKETLNCSLLGTEWYYDNDESLKPLKLILLKVAHNVHDEKTNRIIFTQLYTGWTLEDEFVSQSEFFSVVERALPDMIAQIMQDR